MCFTTCRPRKDIDVARINADEKQVKDVMVTISKMIDPFQDDLQQDGIVNLASSVVAPKDVVVDLVGAFDKGNVAFKHFVSNKLLVDEPDIFSPTSKKKKLKTFVLIKKPAARVTSKGGEIIFLKADRNTFARIFMIGQTRSIDIPEMLSYCLGPYPL